MSASAGAPVHGAPAGRIYPLEVIGGFGRRGLGLCVAVLAACPGRDDGAGTATTTGAGTHATSGTTGPAATTGTTGEPTGGTVGATGSTSGGTTTAGATSGGATTTGDPLLEECQSGAAAGAQVNEYACECAVAAGEYPDLAACLIDNPPFDAACECEILAQSPDDAAYVGCEADAEIGLAECMVGLACDAEVDMAACFDAYFAALEACGSPSRSSLGQIEVQCRGAPAFMCTSGEAIPADWECDEEADCIDMSDEVPQESKCDGKQDCTDGSDEMGCP